jgi:hypothetical protein
MVGDGDWENRAAMRHTPELQQTGIVLVGHFNPLIFRPSWFASRGLVGEEEAERAAVDVIHAEVVTFALDWLRLQVQRELFVADSDQEPFVRLADLVTGCFNRLRDTPHIEDGNKPPRAH